MEESNFFNSSEFLSAWWVFVGVVAGALIQHALNKLTARSSAKNALSVMKVEAETNLEEVQIFLGHLSRFKEKIGAGQTSQDDFYFPMANFDFSALAPLVNNGYFHAMLGPKLSRHYLDFVRSFSNQNGVQLAEPLRREHEEGKSLDFLHHLEGRAKNLASDYRQLLDAKLPLTGHRVTIPR